MLNLSPTEINEFQQTIREKPEYFIEHALKTPLWEKEKEIVHAVRDFQEVSVKSCHASGKTYTAARIVHWWLAAYNDSVVITTAPTFRQVKEILWREIKAAVQGKKIYREDQVLDTQINIGDKWFALGLSTDRPDQFQGFHSAHLLVVVDEASGISPEIYEAIDGLSPTKILLIGNPLQNTGRFADTFKMPRVKKIHISAFDTPNVKAGTVLIPGLISPQDVERMRTYYGEDSDVYRVRVLGEFPKSESDTLISVDEVAKAIERESSVLPQWEKKMGVDVARFGDDRTVMVIRQMEKVLFKEHFSGSDLMQTVGNIIRIAKDNQVKPQNINIDVIGVGGGVVDRLREQGWTVNAINVSEKASDPEHYLNLRAEIYGHKLKEWIKTADLLKDDDFYELANIKYKFNSKGQMQIESKEDMKKRGLPSPDVADALALTFGARLNFIMPPTIEGAKPYYPELGF